MKSPALELLIATNNEGKVRELAQLFGSAPVILKGLADFENIVEPEETGSTFAENAMLKARSYALQTGTMALADDSGLEIAALNNAPGVLSARYGGAETAYPEKMRLLLAEMAASGDSGRSARFVCSMAVATSEGEILHSAEGICTGRIASEPRGNAGFGYDSFFVPEGYDLTFGELPNQIKRQISHRAVASELIMRFLLDFIDN